MQQCRFLLTILPSPALSAEVDRIRASLFDTIGSFSGRLTRPHLTLCFLDLAAEHQGAIEHAIATGVSGRTGFVLHYDGIRHFPERRTIFIEPVEKDAIAGVRRSVMAALRSEARLREAVIETEHPHLTLAAGLKPAQFNGAWALLAPHVHRSEERVTELVLLKRLFRPGERYEHVRSFPLG